MPEPREIIAAVWLAFWALVAVGLVIKLKPPKQFWWGILGSIGLLAFGASLGEAASVLFR